MMVLGRGYSARRYVRRSAGRKGGRTGWDCLARVVKQVMEGRCFLERKPRIPKND